MGAVVRHAAGVALNPGSQYADDRNLRARQRLWQQQVPRFDLVGWVLGVSGVTPGLRVLDVGCGNGMYLREMASRRVEAVGCDLSLGMLGSVGHHPGLVNADVTAIPMRDDSFDIVLAPHMLYHVADRRSAAHELRRVLRPEGCCVVVTNGAAHLQALRKLVEAAVGKATPGWRMRNPSTHEFSLDNGAQQLEVAFDTVESIRPDNMAPVSISDAAIAAEYVASVADHYEDEVDCSWRDVVEDVRREVQQVIDAEGVFEIAGDSGAFICH
jgi:ubiquinone/menaquinone biosynthesis C-methylase UbiE